MTGWEYEEVPLANVQSTNSLLARIVVAKIEDEPRLIQILQTTPVVQNDPTWRCRSWVADVLGRHRAIGLGPDRGAGARVCGAEDGCGKVYQSG